MFPPWVKRITQLFFLLLSTQLLALPDDNKQPLLVKADSADLSQTQHLGVYQGHVSIDQGSTHIRSDKTTTVGNADNKLVKAIFEGNAREQAHYWTQQTQDKPPLHAYADKICYCPEQFQIILIGHARVVQENNQITASMICYNIKTQRVRTPLGDDQTTINIQSGNISPVEPHV